MPGAAKLRVERSIGPAHSDQLAIGPLFVNLVAVSAAPYAGARRGDALRLLPGGGIEAICYPATGRVRGAGGWRLGQPSSFL